MSLNNYSDVDLIEELELRGYVVYDEDSAIYDSDIEQKLERLYLDYMMIGGTFFENQLRNFFNEYLNTTLLQKEK